MQSASLIAPYPLAEQQLFASLKQDMVRIPAGTFMRGSYMHEVDSCVSAWAAQLVEAHFTKDMFREWILKEYPATQVSLKSFSIGKYPVTNGQHAVYTSSTGAALPESLLLGKPENHPVWGLDLAQVSAFLQWLSERMGVHFRLPSEAEWEYAAKGPGNSEYPFGDIFNAHCCNTLESGISDTTPVNQYEAYCSPFGVCDLAGNVEEWTADTYQPYPGGKFIEDDLYKALGPDYPVTKGGSFTRGGDLARCARRHGPFPSDTYKYIGFRLATSCIL